MRSKCKLATCSNAGLTEGYCHRHQNHRPTRRYKALLLQAKYRGIKIKLSKTRYFALLNDTMGCTYCGGSLEGTGTALDRIDPNKGYSIKNVLPCCSLCNNLRGNYLTVEETKELVKVLKQLRGKNFIWDTQGFPNKKRKRKK